jgi:hypothetical protein
VAGLLLLAFGVLSSAALIAFGAWQALRRSYRDRFGVAKEGAAALRAGLVVAFVGACELLLTVYLWAVSR